MLILAHRGASADAPENTLPAFREAVAQGADGIELDVRRCASGEVVVCHDEDLQRLAGLSWRVASTSFWKLSRADVGTKLGFSKARIPLLEEVIAELPERLWLNVELKSETLDDEGLTLATAELLAGRPGGKVVVSSFNPLCLIRLARSHPGLKRAYLVHPDRSLFLQARLLAPLLSPYAIHPSFEACTPSRVKGWKDAGWKVGAWTVDDAERAGALEAAGVDYLFTNRPRELRRALRSRGRR